MDAVLDEYALELLGAALREAQDDAREPLPKELRELCARLKDREGGDAAPDGETAAQTR